MKYEDMKGALHTEQVNANDEADAKSKALHPPLEWMWCEELKLF